jgi:site-specific DNA-cytosine methylase
MRIAVLFDGAGLARLGLEQAGHECVGVELNPVAHHLGQYVGSGNCVLGDAKEFSLKGFDAVWASPPCQGHSVLMHADTSLLGWSLAITTPVLWVENVVGEMDNSWGVKYNAGQFLRVPVQNRQRVIGGRHLAPEVYRAFKPNLAPVPCVTASEWKPDGWKHNRRSSRFLAPLGRIFTIEECAELQGFEIPNQWMVPSIDWVCQYGLNARSDKQLLNWWFREIYKAIGNGVPVYMAKAFGDKYV